MFLVVSATSFRGIRSSFQGDDRKSLQVTRNKVAGWISRRSNIRSRRVSATDFRGAASIREVDVRMF